MNEGWGPLGGQFANVSFTIRSKYRKPAPNCRNPPAPVALGDIFSVARRKQTKLHIITARFVSSSLIAINNNTSIP